jgi:hypothetical protein
MRGSVFFTSPILHSGFGAHPLSHSMGVSGRVLKLATQIELVPTLIMSGVKPPLPQISTIDLRLDILSEENCSRFL